MPALYIDIQAKFAQFQDAIAHVDKQLSGIGSNLEKGFVRAMDGIRESSIGMLKTLAGFSIGFGLTEFAKSAIESTAALDDMAKVTGASVEGLDRLRKIARIGGNDVSVLETGMVRLTKALAGTGTEETAGAARAINAIGLSVEKLKSMTPDEAFNAFAQALGKFNDGAGKTSVAIAALGKSGAQLLPYLDDIARMSDVVGKRTTEEAEAAKHLEEQWNKLSMESKSLATTMVVDMVPAMSRLIEQFSEGKKIAGGFWESIRLFGLQQAPGNVAQQIKDINEEMGKVRDSPWLMQGAQSKDARLADLQKRLDFAKFLQRQEALTLGQDKSFSEAENRRFRIAGKQDLPIIPAGKEPTDKSARTAISDGQRLIDQLTERLQKEDHLNESQTLELNLARGKYAVISSGETQAARALALRIDASNEAQALEKERLDMDKQYVEALKSHFAPMDEELQKLKDQNEFYGLTQAQISAITQSRLEDALAIAQQNGASDEAVAFLQRELDLRSQITGQLSKLDLKKVENDTVKVDDATRQLGLTFTSAFEDAIVGGKSFRDILKGIEQDIVRIAIRKNITEPITNSLSSSGGLASIVGLVKGFFGFADGGVMTGGGPLPLRRYAGGGIAATKQLAMFGEGSMPEAYVPLPDGRSILVTMQGGGGDMIVNVIESPGKGGQTSARNDGGTRVIDVFVEQVKSAIAGDIGRGQGAVPAAMERSYGLNRAAGAY